MAVMTVLEIDDVGLVPELTVPQSAEVGAHAGRGLADPAGTDVAARVEVEVDAYADCPRVWCSFADGPAQVLDGFCACCGACDHDCV
ncbi:hypothetical protein [Georgenia muralis]|uniref:Uncharacterized protein n=1 Tax=Georgenia muralis TaxID=154117 RepID=A0A3N4Z4D5_9MICO|nr:hypothetical protein [Georgenia muralis]RPF26734.1 hypothetical protein EDD32_1184 [Georgenia muralis]